jgi:hypothetical protein
MIFMVMKKIKLTESDLYNIIKRVLLEQEEEKRTVTFDLEKFKLLITLSGERFVKHLNNKYDEIIVNGNLSLGYTPIKSLPNNLRVEGNLNLYGTPIQSLPNNLRVEWNLYLDGTPIQSLPDNLDVKGTIYIKGTPLNKNDELVKKYREKYTIDRV